MVVQISLYTFLSKHSFKKILISIYWHICNHYLICCSIEGEYVPLPGDEVEFKLCPIPPKFEKNQAVHVSITNLTPEVHLKWDCPSDDIGH